MQATAGVGNGKLFISINNQKCDRRCRPRGRKITKNKMGFSIKKKKKGNKTDTELQTRRNNRDEQTTKHRQKEDKDQ